MDENIITPKNEQQKNNNLVYGLILLLIIAVVFIFSIYTNNEMIKKDDFQKNYVKKDDIVFNMLSAKEQNKYMYIDAHLRQIDTLNNKIKDLKTNNKSVVKNKPTTIEKIVEVEKIIKVKEDCKAQIKQKVGKLEQLVRLQQKAILSIRSGTSSIDKTKYKTYTCKDMLKGSFYIPKSCTKMLYKFLDKNKDAKMFEVIGVVDASEFKVLTKIKEPQNKSKVIKIANFAQLGLAYRRVKEGKWAIRYYLDKNVNIQVVNYIIKSKKKSKGFVVRAYK